MLQVLNLCVYHLPTGFTLKDVKNRCPHKRYEAANGYHAKLFTLFADNGADTEIVVPVGVSAYTETKEKLGKL